MALIDLLAKWLGRESESSKETAKQRLRLVLVHDRASINPDVLDKLKSDLIAVITKYLEVDVTGLEVNLEHSEKTVALVANIPIRKMRRTEAAQG